jgi:hypothetical protein
MTHAENPQNGFEFAEVCMATVLLIQEEVSERYRALGGAYWQDYGSRLGG